MTNQLNIFDYNPSRVAYSQFVQPFLGELHTAIIDVLRKEELSAPQIAEKLGDSLDNVMSRISELKADNRIEVVDGRYYYRELITRAGKKKLQPYRVYKVKE